MSTWKPLAACLILCLPFAACTTVQGPIIAGAVDTVGVSVAGGPQAQGAPTLVEEMFEKIQAINRETYCESEEEASALA